MTRGRRLRRCLHLSLLPHHPFAVASSFHVPRAGTSIGGTVTRVVSERVDWVRVGSAAVAAVVLSRP